MLPKTARPTSSGWWVPATVATTPEPTVMRASAMPTSIVTWLGLILGLLDMDREPSFGVPSGTNQTQRSWARVSVAQRLGVGLAQAGGHGGQELASQTGHLVEHAGELALAEHQHLEVGVG